MSWRGPNLNGIAADQTPPTNWSEDKNVVWKTKVPGRGHASPTVVGDLIVLATADESDKTQSVVAFDLATGEQKWITQINQGGFNSRIHGNNTHASPTVISDGERLFAVFNNNDGAQLAALNLDGKLLWEKKAGTFKQDFPFGFGASPAIYADYVIVASECTAGGSLAAFNRETGEEVWRASRTRSTSYSSPVVVPIGEGQLVLSGGEMVEAYDPRDGTPLWSVSGPWRVTCGTAVWDGDMVFVSGGFPRGTTMGIDTTGGGKVAWKNAVKCYEQSMLAHDGYIYAMSDRGIVYCWRASDGQEMWKQRLASPVSASPVLANGNIYISIQDGRTFVFEANPQQYVAIAENQLGNSAFATPSFVGNRILARVGQRDDGYQEWLYCLGE